MFEEILINFGRTLIKCWRHFEKTLKTGENIGKTIKQLGRNTEIL